MSFAKSNLFVYSLCDISKTKFWAGSCGPEGSYTAEESHIPDNITAKKGLIFALVLEGFLVVSVIEKIAGRLLDSAPLCRAK